MTSTSARRDVARLTATTIVDAPAFPFPHLLEMTIVAHDDRLVIDTMLVPTGDRKVPGGVGMAPVPARPGHAPFAMVAAPPRRASTSPSTTAASRPATSHASRPRTT